LSGIAAVLNLDGSAVSRVEVERMAGALKPYGRDQQKILLRGPVAFVSCVHFLTPEDLFERQPVLIANRFIMSFDGRIDNRSELGDALQLSKGELHATPDGLIASRLFDRWGEEAFQRIVGEFALIVMDLQKGALICARDHMGLRVLHYHRSAKSFAVATAPEVLFALSGVSRVLNKEKVADTLVQRGLNGEMTYYKEIYRVLPGHIVRMARDKFSKDRFWDPRNIADVRFKSDHQYVEAFREHLDSAVRARLRSCRTPCATITGGLDSSSIAVIAADMLVADGKKLNTFTAVPEAGFFREETRGNYFDETPYVRKIAEANPGLIPHFIPPSKAPVLEQIAEQIRLGGAPSGSTLNGLWVMDIYAAARSAGHNIMLVGEMGNLIMSYHGRGLFAELFRKGKLLRLFDELKHSGYQWRTMLRQWTIAPFVPAPLFRTYKRWRRGGRPAWYGFAINPDFAISSGVAARAAREDMPFDAPPPRDNRLCRVNDFQCYSETADWFARLRAGFGIDTRTPAFDRRLVEFCIGIPEDQYLRKGCDRWLIRRAMQGRLPEVVLNKKKYGAQSVDWYPRLTRERKAIAEKINSLGKNVNVASIVDLRSLAAILDSWPKQQPSEYSHEYNLLLALPDALGAAYFIEGVTVTN
jgi:asparagine synthase (glutamine-hydrolysing)